MEQEKLLQEINWALDAAEAVHLRNEVVCSAMIALKNNSDLSIVAALAAGLKEWDV